VARTEQELKEQAEREAAELKEEKELALAEADQEHQGDLAAQKAALEKEKAKALSEKEQVFTEKLDQQKELLAKVAEELGLYVQALEAKIKIVEELNENFKDFDTSAVEIDEKTGKVKLHFQESYFARGSSKLSEDMKSILRIMIPKYARGIYGNKDAAAHVESLKISGMTSPVYRGVYIDINDKSPGTERAREYNMSLSNRRARAMYDFIFDEDEMGDYEFRSRLKADMSIAALGFQNATPVKDELVGKPAKCIEYDCKQERATVLQFRLFSEE
jgi:outer membrane protein OmpA-like peptidoglycan-associated protein